MLAFMAVFRRSRNVRWGLVFLLAVLFTLGGCGGGGSSDKKPTPDPKPQPLTLTAPVIDGALIAGMPRELQLGYRYDPALIDDDSAEVRFSLEAAPMGMTLFEDIGTLLWTPSPALEGSQHTVRVRAALGDATAEVTFTLSVALSIPVATLVVGNTVEVTQPGSLQGFSITVPDRASRPASQVQVRVVDEAQAPQLPEGVVRLSDFFVVSPVTVDEGAIVVSLPSALVPSGMHVEDLSLFTYEKAIAFGVWDPDLDFGPSDSASWATAGSNFVITADALGFEVSGLGALSFIGYYPDADGLTGLGRAWAPEVGALTALEPLANGSRCQRQVRPDLSESVRIWECEADGLRLQIRRLAPINWSAGLAPDDVLDWALEARAKIRGLNMNADDRIGVSIEPLASALGQWRPSTPNGLYVRNNQPAMFELTRAEVAKHVLAHEFFHHAQFRTRVDGRENMIGLMVSGEVPKARIVWTLEGTAVWFEDEVYDASNRYRRHVPAAGLPIFLRTPRGLGVVHEDKEAYQYFAWWKMLKSYCPGWSLREVFNVEAGDQTGTRSLANSINSVAWQCRFNPGFENAGGPLHRFAGALLYYALATDNETAQHRNGLALLDANEPQITFEPNLTSTSLTPSAQCGEPSANWFETCPDSARIKGGLGAYRVSKLKLNAVASGSATRSLRIKNTGSVSDLYVLALQDAWPTEGWPKHAGWHVRPSETVTISSTDLGAADTGTWSLWVVNPSSTANLVALAAGLVPAVEPPPFDLSRVISATIRLENLNVTMAMPDGSLEETTTSPTDNFCGGAGWGEGGFTGNKFASYWMARQQGTHATTTGSIDLAVDLESFGITSLKVDDECSHTFLGQAILGMQLGPDATLGAIKASASQPNTLVSLTIGLPVCDALGADGLKWDWRPRGGDWRTLVGYSCSATTVLRTSFSLGD